METRLFYPQLFLGLFEDHSFAELFGVLFELDFALYLALVLAGPVDFAGLLIRKFYQLIL